MSTGLYGEIPGSSPNWKQANMHDKGRVHVSHVAELGDAGFQAWNQQPAPSTHSLRRLYEPSSSQPYCEPVMHGKNIPASYYARRANSADQPTSYRPSMRILPDPGTQRVDRPEGKRQVPEPYGPPPSHGTGIRQAPNSVRSGEPSRLPEPAMPRLSRPVGISGLRESDSELSHEQALGRKVRVDQQTYRGTGRAGDVSTVLQAPLQPDYADPNFFKTLKDGPTFIRFCSTLPPKPAVSPHERRRIQMQRAQEQELQRDRQLVGSLHLADPQEE